MKRIVTLALAAGMLFGSVAGASAIDFKMSGQWLMGFGAADGSLTRSTGTSDEFQALQRVRLQLVASASENLSGTVYFEIGDTQWGNAATGGALGADGKIVEVKRAYIDWRVPSSDLSLRMGLQGVILPNVAGGSAIFDDDVAGIVATYAFNDNIALTALWARPYNDNYAGERIEILNPFTGASTGQYKTTTPNYLDNFDLFALMLPMTFDGFGITPWVAYGLEGRHVASVDGTRPVNYPGKTSGKKYGNIIYAGLPITINAFDPLNIEIDLNYGYAESFGNYYAPGVWGMKRFGSERSGFLAKALVEYKADWGVPGLFGWYGSGDDSNVKNGSERLPTISACGNFTSFMGDDPATGWSVWDGYDLMLSYGGTWGIGAQIRDMSFIENLSHTLRVAWWNGTNSTSMRKYVGNPNLGGDQGIYLTSNDALVEVNLDSTWQIYENLATTVQLGYIGNMMDKDAWRKHSTDFKRQDGWKAAVVFNYSF